jgi:aspartate kinase
MRRQIAVHKFGGTSLADAERILCASDLVRAASRTSAVVAVASAMGGVTDLLYGAARQAEQGRRSAVDVVAALKERHTEAARELTRLTGRTVRFDDSPLADLQTVLSGIALLRERTPRVTDVVASFGERLSAPLLAAAISARGTRAVPVDAREMILTDARHGEAACDRKRSDPRIRRTLTPLIARRVVPVVTGFLGRTPEGETTTLGRSGSDTTAALLGAALKADEVVIWTDVDGILSADPRICSGAHLLERVSYREAAEMTFFGAKVLHFPAVLPAIAAGIPLVIKNSFHPAGTGTTIAAEGEGGRGIRAVTAISGMCLISLDGAGMVGVVGIAARVFSTTARLGVSVVMISQASSEQNIVLVIPESDRERTVAGLEEEFRWERHTGAVDAVKARAPIAIVAAVGDGMRGTPGIAATVFASVAGAKVNVEAIAQGSSECNISFAVEEKDRVAAVRALHGAISPAPGLRPARKPARAGR